MRGRVSGLKDEPIEQIRRRVRVAGGGNDFPATVRQQKRQFSTRLLLGVCHGGRHVPGHHVHEAGGRAQELREDKLQQRLRVEVVLLGRRRTSKGVCVQELVEVGDGSLMTLVAIVRVTTRLFTTGLFRGMFTLSSVYGCQKVRQAIDHRIL